MNVSVTDRFKVSHAVQLYGIDRWAHGYLSVAEDGHLLVHPQPGKGPGLDVYNVVCELNRRGYKTPLMLRFPQLLDAELHHLRRCFVRAIDEYGYTQRYRPVFPIKVNQQRSVVERLLQAGSQWGMGLEAGSRSELMAAMALETGPDSLIVCNGFKDSDYLSTASLAVQLGKQVIVVIEKPFELDAVLDLARAQKTVPLIGFRLRLQARGSGLWEKSGGFASKFGLTTLQLIRCLDRLSGAGLKDRVALLHFHIGSQVTEVRKIKNAVQEASRVYAKLRKLGVDIRYLDVGGGLGVDYDGSKTSSDASVNYSVQEYANDVVFGISEVCEQEKISPPEIITESGRMLVARHSMLVTDVRGVISGVDPHPPVLTGEEAQVVQDLAEVERTMTVKNYREFYHDAIDYRDQLFSLFNLGMLELHERAKGEALFWAIAGKAVRFSKSAKFVAEEFANLDSKLHDKYICNFSLFQSLPDHWALDQLFPVVPIHRLNESPTRKATLVDITCDSDGEVGKFVDLKDIKHALEVHEVQPGTPYYLAFQLIGAYQETMGDMHNLFGGVHQAEVLLGLDGRAELHVVRAGDPASVTLDCFGYSGEALVDSVRSQLDARVARNELDTAEAAERLEVYRGQLRGYTYLD